MNDGNLGSFMFAFSTQPTHLVIAFVAALIAAAINSVAGGGTLVSFPVLLGLGLPPVVANATSTVGIWPGSLGSIWGFRKELGRTQRKMRWLIVPCFIGGISGALLLRSTSETVFRQLVPFLVAFATLLFALRERVQHWLRERREKNNNEESNWLLGISLTLAVGIYGGYFGAGMSIMNLSILGVLGLTDLFEMNALTSLFALAINGVAIALFAAVGLVAWPIALTMALGALLGGYGATGLAKRIGREILGRLVIAIGATVSVVFFLRWF
jgi:uncharacterized membrane protein YfcA